MLGNIASVSVTSATENHSFNMDSDTAETQNAVLVVVLVMVVTEKCGLNWSVVGTVY